MASGIQFLSVGVAPSSATLYTVPAGISHAVVHISIECSLSGAGSGGVYLTVNDQPLFSYPYPGLDKSLETALMLSPGDYIKYINSTSFLSSAVTLLISSYEVP